MFSFKFPVFLAFRIIHLVTTFLSNEYLGASSAEIHTMISQQSHNLIMIGLRFVKQMSHSLGMSFSYPFCNKLYYFLVNLYY